MPRYRNDSSVPLNYSDSGGPWVEPGEEFEHEIPPAQRDIHLGSGVISVVRADAPVDDAHVHTSRELLDALQRAPSLRRRPAEE